jgi:hypothetical protein
MISTCKKIRMIKLIPKGMERDIVGDWQPITLFNVSYKVLAKVLAKVQGLSNMKKQVLLMSTSSWTTFLHSLGKH